MKNQKGFTLTELSIVLIIIGLIIAGIVTGQELISQSKIRGLISDINNVQTSINIFKINYGYWPGDFPNAGSIWTSSTCTNAVAPAGCNGNGNWIIDYSNTSGAESYRFWQHLSLAGLISGTYTGTNSFTDVFHPRYSSSIAMLPRYTAASVQAGAAGQYYSMLEIGNWYTGTSSTSYSSGNTASLGGTYATEAYAIDSKIDDGIAYTGKVYTINGDNYGGFTNACTYWYQVPNGPYNLTGPQILACRMVVRME